LDNLETFVSVSTSRATEALLKKLKVQEKADSFLKLPDIPSLLNEILYNRH
jgi:hypothetical protein